MSELRAHNVSGEIGDNRPVDFTIDDVPDDIQDNRLVGLLYVEILKAGDMVSTGDEVQDRANDLKAKNHVAYWAHVHPADTTNKHSTIRFSMNAVNPNASFGSTDARYAPSDRPSISSFGSTFSASEKPTSSRNAPPSDNVPPDNAPHSVPSGSGSSRDAASVSNVSHVVPVLPEGVPAQGRFDIKIRNYYGKSMSAITSFSFRIIGEPKLRDLLNSLHNRSMLPFYFPKKGFYYSGCRHFAYAILFMYEQSYTVLNLPFFNSCEAVKAWKQDEYIMDRCTKTGGLFRDLIGFRYTPLESLPADPLASSEEGSGEDEGSEEFISGTRKTPNPIDKGSFPTGFQSLTAGYPFAL